MAAGVAPRSCCEGVSITECLTVKNNRVANFAKSANGRDKFFKFIVHFFEALEGILKCTSVSDDTQVGFKTGTKMVKDARSVYAFLNVPFNTFPMMYKNIDTISGLGKNILYQGEGQDYERVDETDKAGNTTKSTLYKGKNKKMLGMVEESAALVGSATYAAGFGICGPIRVVDSHWRLGETSRSIGEQFSFVFMINHFAGVVENTSKAIRVWLGDRKLETEKAWKEFVKCLINLFEKFCEIGVDIVTVFRVQAPLAVKLTLNFIVGCIGVYKVWRDET